MVSRLQGFRSASQASVAEGEDRDDPWKGAFGGLSARNGCILSANVGALLSDPNNFQVDLQVTVDDERRSDLVGHSANFFLHPTFGSRPRVVAIGTDGRASLQIFSYGAFTVGVLIDDGTRLELDLARIAGAPPRFLER